MFWDADAVLDREASIDGVLVADTEVPGDPVLE
jgi:hypothetical protein